MSSQDPTPSAVAPTPHAIPHVVIDPAGDAVIRAYKAGGEKTFIGDDAVTVKRGELLATFQVSRKVLIDNSDFWKKNFSESWSNPTQQKFDVGEVHVVALELWFRIIHQTLVEQSYAVALVEIWHALEICRKYLMEQEKMQKWFREWLRRAGGNNGLTKLHCEDLRALLYPCFTLQDINGFATVTRRLAYEMEGKVTEANPSNYFQFHLHYRVIAAVNAARGNLRTQIHKEIYKDEYFINSSCSCKKDGLFAYSSALINTGAWPLEQFLTGRHQLSIQKVLTRLKGFDYEPPNEGCSLCSQNFDMTVARSVEKVEGNFEGLCLDCMDENDTRDVDDDYRSFNDFDYSERRYDAGCRITHQQPTYYFSRVAKGKKDNSWERERKLRSEERAKSRLNVHGRRGARSGSSRIG